MFLLALFSFKPKTKKKQNAPVCICSDFIQNRFLLTYCLIYFARDQETANHDSYSDLFASFFGLVNFITSKANL